MVRIFRTTPFECLPVKVSCTSPIEDKTYKELVDIQSALNNLPIMKSGYETADPQMTGHGPTCKKPFSCLTCSKSFTSMGNLKTHQKLTLGRNLSAAKHVTTNALTQVV